DGLEVTPGAVDVEVAKFDLTFDFSERWDAGAPAGVGMHVGFATDIFDAETVERLVQRYLRVLESVIADSEAPVGGIELLDPDERASLVPVRGVSGLERRTLPELFA